ncbi:MAG: type I-E CRISPR-associated protein Cas5/CasD [Methanomethylophilus sp.]
MTTLLLRLAGPMQSWGVTGKFSTRSTGREPSKSGVLGLVAAALGRGREEPLTDLTALRYGVRIDQEGTFLRDYHTAHNPENTKLAYLTERHYLADAVFLVGLEGDPVLLTAIEQALRHPFYPLFLGRRSCPPAGRLSLGLREGTLEEALDREEWQAAEWYRRRMPAEVDLETVCDADGRGDGGLVWDNPVSFSPDRRVHAPRSTARNLRGKRMVNPSGRKPGPAVTEHDAIAQLRGA